MASEALKRTSVYSSNKNVDADLGGVCTVICIACATFRLVMHKTGKAFRRNILNGLL